MKVEDCIFFQLAKTSQTATRFWGRQVARFSVTAVQAMVLNFLFDEDKVPSHRLGERTRLDSATLTGILDRLEAMELVERRPHPDDRRAILVCLTAKGKKLAGEIRKTMELANREFLQTLTAREGAALKSLLNKVRAR